MGDPMFTAATSTTESLLASLWLFRGASTKELRELAAMSTVMDLPAGRVIIRQNAHGREFFVLADGAADVSVDGEVVATLGPGDFAGELALLDREPRSASVTLTRPSTVIVFGAREFWGAIATFPSVDRRLLEQMARRLRAADSAGIYPADPRHH